MKAKAIRCIVVTLLLFALMTVPVFALDESQEEFIDDMEQSISGDLETNIPDSAQEMLGENGLAHFDVDAISNFQFTDLFGGIFDMGKNYFTAPFRVFAMLTGVFLLIALINAAHPPASGMVSVQHFVGISAMLLVLSSPVIDCVHRAVDSITQCSQFILSFIPVFTGVVAVSGKPVSSMTYSSFLFGTVEVISQISATVLLPLLCIYLAFCIVGTLNPALKLDAVAGSVKKVVIWVIGLLLTVFVALLSVQSLISGSADTVAAKTTKFLIGSLIPVFGSALSEAFNSVQGCLGFMKQVTGSFGIIVALCTFLPIVIETLMMLLAVNVSQMIGSVLGVERLCGLLKSVSSMLSLLLGLILCFAVMIIISTTIIMMLSMGV